MSTIVLEPAQAGIFEKKLSHMLAKAGIRLNGFNSFDPQIKDRRFCRRLLAEGSLGLGESYMDGWWDCDRIDIFISKIIDAGLDDYKGFGVLPLLAMLSARFTNGQSKDEALNSVSFHYNLGNDLFINMLDRRLTYTCAYWKNARTLDEAQEAKLELTCRKLHLQPGMHVLDIGCGWGSFAMYAAENYGVRVTGVTLSDEQVLLARKRCEGLPVDIKLQDYRDVKGKYDRVVSMGMFEHVGPVNYATYFGVVNRCLVPDGIFLLHTIGSRVSENNSDPWLSKYIFPQAFIPGLVQLLTPAEKYFVAEDIHNFGADYDKTLLAWYENFNRNWPEIAESYDERFYRMWRYYLLFCAGSFRARKNQLWQIVFTRGIKPSYIPVR